MAVGKVNSLAAASIAKINTLAKASIGKLSSIANAFVAAFTDDKAVSKSISTGTGESIQIASTTHFNFVQSDAFSIGFWIRAGWTANLNTNIHFFAMNDGSSTARNESIRIFYLETHIRKRVKYHIQKLSIIKIGCLNLINRLSHCLPLTKQDKLPLLR